MTSRAADIIRSNTAVRKKLYADPITAYEHPAAVEARNVVVQKHPFFKRRRVDRFPTNQPSSSSQPTANSAANPANPAIDTQTPTTTSNALITIPDKPAPAKKPRWHPPWKTYRVISSHLGWVHCATFDPQNAYFATGSSDRTIKLFDTASGRLKLTLTGHISSIRSLKISARHPYLFSASEDKMVKCWDMEYNKVIRHYHGHLSGVYALALHEMLDVVVSGGRDSTVRVWDMRSRNCVFVWGSHRDTVNDVVMNSVEPQIISASADSTVRMWNLSVAKTQTVLTNHKKGVRALARHPIQSSFASASADNIKTWHLPRGSFVRNVGRVAVVNDVAVNQDGLVVAGCDDGYVRFWDWEGGGGRAVRGEVQPGSLDAENGVLGLAFDMSGSRLVSCHVDKTIRMWKEDETATESDPMPLAAVDNSRY